MEHFSDNLSGFFNSQELYQKVVNDSNTNSHFVEVGSFLGQSSSFMCVEIINSGKNIKFDCVDPWKDGEYLTQSYLEWTNYPNPERCSEEDFFYGLFIENMRPVEDYYTPIRNTSIQASTLYDDNQLDFVFLDSMYTVESISEQISAWWPKIKIGGTIGIHDTNEDFIFNGVKSCFDENSITRFIGEKTDTILIEQGIAYETSYLKKESESQLK